MIGIASIVTGSVALVVGLVLPLVGGGAGVASVPASLGQTGQEATSGCALIAPEVDAEPWVRTELFFGMDRPDGTAITESEWQTFLDSEVTTRFPEGLTVLSGAGQWQGEDEEIVQEGSKIVILLYPREAIAESNAEIEDIRTAYEREFQQESVLRADDDRPVCTSF